MLLYVINWTVISHLRASVFSRLSRLSCTASYTVAFNGFNFHYQLCQDEENLHYAALRDHKINRERRKRDDTWNECVYSSVKQ